MSRITIVLICVIFLITDVASFGKYFRKMKRLAERSDAYDLDLKHTIKPPKQEYPDLYLQQPLDHFDPLVQSTYNQRYWVNSDLWRKPDGPVFLQIGGEGGLSFVVVEEGEYVDLAKDYGALIIAVEHRYYGKSINADGLALENLKYLSSQQALADLAAFHTFACKKYNLTEANTWISFGGSYPGSLSAWFRLKYPHLVYGAIASSAPVEAVVNFEGYNDVVKNSLSDGLVNGSAKCASNIREAFKTVDTMLENQQNVQLSKDFNSCQVVIEEGDVYNFVSNLADIFMGTVQYNTRLPTNITSLCAAMTDDSQTPYENLKRLIMGAKKDLNQLLGEKENCTDNSWSQFIKELSNTTMDKVGGSAERQWLYQTCSQFGYYQTCDEGTSCLFSRHMSLDFNLRMCPAVFAIPVEEVYKRVEFTNAYYGSDQPRGTRIVFVNGSVDPWHSLSVLKDIGESETAIYIPGTAHCANMYPVKPTDPPQLTQARKMIKAQVGQWLNDAKWKVLKD